MFLGCSAAKVRDPALNAESDWGKEAGVRGKELVQKLLES